MRRIHMDNSFTKFLDILFISSFLSRLQFFFCLFTICLSLIKLVMTHSYYDHLSSFHFWWFTFEYKYWFQSILHHLDRLRKNSLNMTKMIMTQKNLPRNIALRICKHQGTHRRICANCDLRIRESISEDTKN